MYSITKRVEIAGAHFLNLPYPSKCHNVHGHNWLVDITIQGEQLSNHGMLVDFTHIKKFVHSLDHKFLMNEMDEQGADFGAYPLSERLLTHFEEAVVGLPVVNTTAECMCKYIFDCLTEAIGKDDNATGKVTEVSIQESEGNVACYKQNTL